MPSDYYWQYPKVKNCLVTLLASIQQSSMCLNKGALYVHPSLAIEEVGWVGGRGGERRIDVSATLPYPLLLPSNGPLRAFPQLQGCVWRPVEKAYRLDGVRVPRTASITLLLPPSPRGSFRTHLRGAQPRRSHIHAKTDPPPPPIPTAASQ
jgi:hypothetical protein